MTTATIYRLWVDGSYIDFYTREKRVNAIAEDYKAQGKEVQIIVEEVPTYPVKMAIL